jgi:hypothetical protein
VEVSFGPIEVSLLHASAVSRAFAANGVQVRVIFLLHLSRDGKIFFKSIVVYLFFHFAICDKYSFGLGHLIRLFFACLIIGCTIFTHANHYSFIFVGF